MTVINFDRDLKYSHVIGDNLGIGASPAKGTLAVPVMHTNGAVTQKGGYVNYVAKAGMSLENDECLTVGVMLKTAKANDVFRVRGCARGIGNGAVVYVIAAMTNTPSAAVTLSDWSLIGTSGDIDHTIALDGAAMNEAIPNHTVLLGVMIHNSSGQAANLFPQIHLSVQDLRVAPPEYEAARR